MLVLSLVGAIVASAPAQASQADPRAEFTAAMYDFLLAHIKFSDDFKRAEGEWADGALVNACADAKHAASFMPEMTKHLEVAEKGLKKNGIDAATDRQFVDLDNLQTKAKVDLDFFQRDCKKGTSSARVQAIATEHFAVYNRQTKIAGDYFALATGENASGKYGDACSHLLTAYAANSNARYALVKLIQLNPAVKLYQEQELQRLTTQATDWDKEALRLKSSYCEAAKAEYAEMDRAQQLAAQQQAARDAELAAERSSQNPAQSGSSAAADARAAQLRAECAAISRANEQHKYDSNWSRVIDARCYFN